MKILLLGEFSGLNNELKSALINKGCQVTLASGTDSWKKFESDINLGYGSNLISYKARQLALPFINLKKFQGFDVVHIINFYIFPRFPLLNLWLVKHLKENNKIVTLSGAGDNPVHVKYVDQVLRYSPLEANIKHDRILPYYMKSGHHLSVMQKYMKYIDGVIPIMYDYYAPYCAAGYESKTSKPIAIPINASSIPFHENKVNNKVIFFHGLNRRGSKGTFLIEPAFDRMRSKYPNDVECIIAGKLPFNEYMKLLSRVNISVDQVFSYSLAMNALYSMCQGKVVAGGCEKESAIIYDGKLPPVHNLLPDVNKITETFEKILENRKDIKDQSLESRYFVEKYHAPEIVAQKYLDYWKNIY